MFSFWGHRIARGTVRMLRNTVAPGDLGLVHGLIRTPDKRFHVFPFPVFADADTYRDMGRFFRRGKEFFFRNRLGNPPGNSFRLCAVGLRQDNGKLFSYNFV